MGIGRDKRRKKCSKWLKPESNLICSSLAFHDDVLFHDKPPDWKKKQFLYRTLSKSDLELIHLREPFLTEAAIL